MNFISVKKLTVSGLLVAAASVSTASTVIQKSAKTVKLCDGIAPPNDFYVPEFAERVDGITEAQFNDVMDRIQKVYTPIVAQAGGQFVIERNWSDGTVNAYADRSGSTWTIHMFGGLARSAPITPDSMMAVACHEIGHHLGGQPTYSGYGNDWAADEGQADYYAMLKCFRIMAAANALPPQVRPLQVDPNVARECTKSFPNAADLGLCQRAAQAGLELATLLNNLGGAKKPVNFATPDKSVVNKTNDEHPEAQCRLDTYFAGNVCTVPYTVLTNMKEPFTGTCNKRDKFTRGLRPTCWFKEPASFATAPTYSFNRR